MSKIKVIFFLKSLGIGGTEKSAQLFAKYLDKDKFDLHVLYHRLGSLSRLRCFRKIPHLKLWPFDDDRDVLDDIKSIRPDIFQVFKSGYQDGFPDPEDVPLAKYCIYNIFGFVDRNPRIAKDIFMSKWLMENNFSRRQHPRFDYVSGPADLPNSQFNLRKLLKISDDEVIIGRSGRDDNGIYDPIAVNAMANLKNKHNFIYLVLSPPDNMVKDLYEKEIPYIILKPTVGDKAISRFYNTLDIYAHSRLDGETCGLNISEAMMHGKPIITHFARPNNPGVYPFQAQTVLVEHGHTGFVSDGVEQYTTYLETLLANLDLCHEMGAAGKEKALKEFESSVSVKKLEKIYLELI